MSTNTHQDPTVASTYVTLLQALPPSIQSALGPPLGHAWTIASHLRRGLRAPLRGQAMPFEVTLTDEHTGLLKLCGTLHHPARAVPAREIVVLVHGLGGSVTSGYMTQGARAALDLEMCTLQINLRGADPRGHDFYHAGLSSDILAVLSHPLLAEFEHVYVLGFSLGGHVSLRAAMHPLPCNVRAFAALCPPLDLAATAATFDTRSQWVYRRHILAGLKKMYARFLQRAERVSTNRSDLLTMPSLTRAQAITSIRDWDEQIVAPRHGFTSAATYYATQSAGSRLQDVTCPSLVVTTRWDPMVPRSTTAPSLTSHSYPSTQLPQTASLQSLVRVAPQVVHAELPWGGHVAFPRQRNTLGPPTLLHSVLQWMRGAALPSSM